MVLQPVSLSALEGHKAWLTKSLATTLGWDAVLAEGITEAIGNAVSKPEADAIVKVRGEGMHAHRPAAPPPPRLFLVQWPALLKTNTLIHRTTRAGMPTPLDL